MSSKQFLPQIRSKVCAVLEAVLQSTCCSCNYSYIAKNVLQKTYFKTDSSIPENRRQHNLIKIVWLVGQGGKIFEIWFSLTWFSPSNLNFFLIKWNVKTLIWRGSNFYFFEAFYCSCLD